LAHATESNGGWVGKRGNPEENGNGLTASIIRRHGYMGSGESIVASIHRKGTRREGHPPPVAGIREWGKTARLLQAGLW